MYGYLKLFPKKDRYTLGQKLDSLTLTIFELILMTGTSQRDKKLLYLEKAIISLDLLKILLRLAKDVQALDNSKYLQLEQLLQEMGRMLGGWKRSLSQI